VCAIGYEETSGNGGILVRDPHVLVRFLVVDHDVCKRYANKRVTRLVVFFVTRTTWMFRACVAFEYEQGRAYP